MVVLDRMVIALQNIIFRISKPKHMLWVLKRTVSRSEHPKRMLKMIGKTIFTFLRSKTVLI